MKRQNQPAPIPSSVEEMLRQWVELCFNQIAWQEKRNSPGISSKLAKTNLNTKGAIHE